MLNWLNSLHPFEVLLLSLLAGVWALALLTWVIYRNSTTPRQREIRAQMVRNRAIIQSYPEHPTPADTDRTLQALRENYELQRENQQIEYEKLVRP